MRMDGRLEWVDLLMRMEYPGTTEQDESKVRNRLQQRMARFRERFTMVAWRDTAGDNNGIRDRVLNKLTPAQLAARGGLGSTRGTTPGSRDSQGRVIPVPGRRPRGTANAGSMATQVQQPPTRTAHAGPSNASSRQHSSVAYTGFSDVNSQQNQTRVSHGGSSRTSQHNAQTNTGNGSRQRLLFPGTSSVDLLGGRRTANTNISMAGTPYSPPSTFHAVNDPPRPYSSPTVYPNPSHQTQSKAFHTGPSANQYSQHHTIYIGPSSSQNERPDSPQSDTSFNSLFDDENDGGNGDHGSDEDHGDDHDDDDSEDREDSDNSDDSEQNGDTDDDNKDDEDEKNDENDVEMPFGGGDSRLEELSADERRELEWYIKEDRTITQMCLDGRISLAELDSAMQINADELIAGIKRARGETSDDDDELQEMQNRRTKRTKRGENAGPSGERLSESRGQGASFDRQPTQDAIGNPQPRSRGEYNRHGALANTSRRPNARPIGSAVQRLHNDPLRRPAPKATNGQKDPHKALYLPVMGDEEYTIYFSQTVPQQGDDNVRVDPSTGTLNGHADANHVGRVNTHPQQRTIDAYYRRLMAPHPRTAPASNAPAAAMPPPPRPRAAEPPTVFVADLLNPHSRPQIQQPFIPYNIPGAVLQAANAPPVAQVPTGISAEEPDDGLDVGDIALWGGEWDAFVNDHDSGSLLRGHCPDEYR